MNLPEHRSEHTYIATLTFIYESVILLDRDLSIVSVCSKVIHVGKSTSSVAPNSAANSLPGRSGTLKIPLLAEPSFQAKPLM
jgi:hypothetical protein